MEQVHDPVRHLKFFRQALSQDKRIGFLISAGCPLGVDMPAGKWPLIPDIENLTKLTSETIIKSANKVKYEKLLEELTKTGKSKDNIEDILSFLRGLKQVAKGGTVRGFSFDDLELLEKELCKVVVTSMDVTLPDSETSYHKLANWINSIEREYPIEIFTTNYDLLMEQAFEEINVPYFDGFVGSKNTFLDLRILEDDSRILPKHWTCLWKIHGSINWYHEKGNVTRLSLVNKDGNNLIYPSHLKYEESRKMPYLVFMDRLSKFIRRPSSLLIASGYSFRDEHINNTVFNALKSQPNSMVIGLFHGSLDKYPEAIKAASRTSNLSLLSKDEAIVGTIRGKWKLSKTLEPDENIADCIKIEKTTVGTPPVEVENIYCKLGDFKKLGDFLQFIIGSNKFLDTDAK
ncbi:MAG: SIR2 family protein [Bacteroidota bacterium]